MEDLISGEEKHLKDFSFRWEKLSLSIQWKRVDRRDRNETDSNFVARSPSIADRWMDRQEHFVNSCRQSYSRSKEVRRDWTQQWHNPFQTKCPKICRSRRIRRDRRDQLRRRRRNQKRNERQFQWFVFQWEWRINKDFEPMSHRGDEMHWSSSVNEGWGEKWVKTELNWNVPRRFSFTGRWKLRILLRNWPDWDEHHSPSSTSSLDLCPTKVFGDLIVWYLLSWPVDLFLSSSSFFSNLNDLLRRFCSNASCTRQIRRLIISFDRWTHSSNIFSLLFSRWAFLSLHLLIKLRLLLFLVTHTHSLSKQWCLWR